MRICLMGDIAIYDCASRENFVYRLSQKEDVDGERYDGNV